MSVNNKLIPVPFAENAGDTWKYSIPNSLTSSDESNKASYDTGFPPVTMTPIEAGGIPFFGQDVNGILNEATTAIRFMQTGDYQSYNADFSKSIGGYPKDAQIKGSDGIVYVCTTDGNTSDPTGLDGWQTFLSSATDSESETQAATSLAVKKAYDVGNNALPLTGGTVTGETDFTDGLKSNGNEVLTKDDFSGSITTSGYQKLPSGLIMQWGTGSHSVVDANKGVLGGDTLYTNYLGVNFPKSFSKQILFASGSPIGGTYTDQKAMPIICMYVNKRSTTGMDVSFTTSAPVGWAIPFTWIAIGV